MEATAHPFATLTPDRLLDAVESLGLACDGRVLALNSYENRVFQIGMAEGPPLVAKFYRPERWSAAQIQEEHDFTAEMAAAELPVVAPVRLAGASLFAHGGFHFALYPKQGGRDPELEDPAVLHWLGRLMARIHNIGARQPFLARPTLDSDSFGYEACDWLVENGAIPEEVYEVWEGVAVQALDEVAACYERAGEVPSLRLHGDCHRGNVLWTADGPHFVDFDDARRGPAVQDLWMFLAGEADDMAVQLRHVLEGYEMFRAFDRRELHLIEALRTLRLIHHAAWLAMRWDDPAFPAAFPWFATPRYWEERILELREQIARMQESALVRRRL